MEPSNKEMKLTSVERIGRSQLISSVKRTCCSAGDWVGWRREWQATW
jgi:hypothetical protein